jgi:hypothetical protein
MQPIGLAHGEKSTISHFWFCKSESILTLFVSFQNKGSEEEIASDYVFKSLSTR